MSADTLLSMLDGVRERRRGEWSALCPAHDDRHPSLSVMETDDGVVLVRCFAGCETADVLAAVGLEFDALFPSRDSSGSRPLRRPWSARDVLEVMADEAQVVAIEAARMVAVDYVVTVETRDRLLLAASRLRTAAEGCHG